ncbi:MAG: hypothetical protein R3247_08865, partial [Rhodothermales bacterium]|nr:hypothetical protein [Rhodothermales bacterium]
AVIDRVVAAAAAPPTRSPGARADRAARPSVRLRRFRMAGALAATFALLIAVGLWWRGTPLTFDAAEALSDAPMAAESAPPAVEAAPAPEADAAAVTGAAGRAQPAPAPPAAALARREALLPADRPLGAAADAAPAEAAQEEHAALAQMDAAKVAGAEDLPAWDEADEVLRLHNRIELLEARARQFDWDEAAVMSLDRLPAENAAAPRALTPAGQRKPPGGH